MVTQAHNEFTTRKQTHLHSHAHRQRFQLTPNRPLLTNHPPPPLPPPHPAHCWLVLTTVPTLRVQWCALCHTSLHAPATRRRFARSCRRSCPTSSMSRPTPTQTPQPGSSSSRASWWRCAVNYVNVMMGGVWFVVCVCVCVWCAVCHSFAALYIVVRAHLFLLHFRQRSFSRCT